MSNRYSKNQSTRDSKSPDLDPYVKGIPFHLHKTLAKRSAKVSTLLECNKLDELRWILRDMDIDSRTFELVARFCYGYEITFGYISSVHVSLLHKNELPSPVSTSD